jgi:hypothetical protein
VFLNQRGAEFSLFYTKRSSLDLFIQTIRPCGHRLGNTANKPTKLSDFHS